MFVIIWKYQVKEDCVARFEKIYGENGEWAQLFRKQSGYCGTELLRDSNRDHTYITIDRWASIADYDLFFSNWKTDYEILDAQCEDLAQQEILLGKWESFSSGTQ